MKFLPYFALALLLPGVSANSNYLRKTVNDATVGKPIGTEIAERLETCEPSYTNSNSPDYYYKFSCDIANSKVSMLKYSDCACTTETSTETFDDGYTTGGFKYECQTNDLTGFIYSTTYTTSSCASACKVEHLAMGICLKGDLVGDGAAGIQGSRKLVKEGTNYKETLYTDDACSTGDHDGANGALDACNTPSANLACGDGTNTGTGFKYNFYEQTTDASTLQDVCNGAPAVSASSGAAALGAAAPAALSLAAAILLSYFA